MRKKIEELRNKEEGFTLVELLAVIVILGIIVAIAVPMIGNVVGDSQTEADEAEVELIEDAARLYHIDNDVTNGEISVDELVEAGYLEMRNSKTDGKVIVTEISTTGGVTYEFQESE